MTTLFLFLFFIILLLIGIPVGFSLAIAGTVGMLFTMGIGKVFATLPTLMHGSLNNFVLIAIPLYVLMGNIIIHGKLSDEIYDTLNEFVGHLHGGLAIITVLFCTIFAAISGSSVATAATVGMIVLPEMLRLKYKRDFIFGLTAAGGTLGIMIPPSLNMIIYGALTEVSVGKLFIAGVIPGLILGGLFMLYAVIYSRIKGYKSEYRSSWRRRLISLKNSFFSLLVIPAIMVGIYTGIFTPTEAAGVGAVYVLIVAVLKKKFGWHTFYVTLIETLKTSCMVLMIIVGAIIFGYIVTVLQFPQQVVAFIVEHNVTPLQFIIGTFFLILFLGCFVECVTIMVIMTPLLYPIVLNLNIDPIWFGVFLTVTMELALVTPPVGLNLFVINTIVADSKLEEVYKGVWPFIAIMVLSVAIFYLLPDTATWLPSLMEK